VEERRNRRGSLATLPSKLGASGMTEFRARDVRWEFKSGPLQKDGPYKDTGSPARRSLEDWEEGTRVLVAKR